MRVIAGLAKGRRLIGPPGQATRPMTDRAKEGIFSAIAADIPGAEVLDLFAGSGSLGLEALSRGARSVIFVERDRAAVAALRTNVERVDLGGSVVAGDVERFLTGSPGGIDVAFVDPPYPMLAEAVTEVLEALVDCLNEGALVVLHRRTGEPRPTAEGLIPEGERTYGTAQIWRYRRAVRQLDDEEQG